MEKQIATFYLGNALFGIDILIAREVYRQMIVSPTPGAPKHLRGLMNLRGKVVTLVDLNVALNRGEPLDINDSRLLIIKTQDEIRSAVEAGLLENIRLGEDIVGFLIDRMADVLLVDHDAVLPPPPNLDDINHELVYGVVERNDDLVIVLDVEAILNWIMNTAETPAGTRRKDDSKIPEYID